MALHLVLLPTILAFALMRNEHCVPSPTTRTTTTPPTTTTATFTTTPKACPHAGYQPFPGFNCYKAFTSRGEVKTWSEARVTCKGDGGDLMVIDTVRERKEVYVPLFNSLIWYDYPWVGVYIPQGGNDWKTVKGEPVPSTWWRPGEPDGNAADKCAHATSTGLLANDRCALRTTFICEISL